MVNNEQCPTCGTELSKVKFNEILAKIKEDERQKSIEQKKKIAESAMILRHQLEQQFEQERQKQREAAEKLAKQEADQQIKKVSAERDAAAKKLKEAEARETEIKKQAEVDKRAAEKLAKEAADKEIKKIASERDATAKKLKDAEAREAQIIKQAQDEADKKRQVELLKQRQVLEKERDSALLKREADFNREREAWQKKVKGMEHQLQKKTANELGDGAEIDLFEELRAEFPRDHITRVQKGQTGADIHFEVLHKGQSCGKIIIDSKNRHSWQNSFVTKLHQDQLEAEAEHAILASTVFPAGKREMCIEGGVIVVSPARVVCIARMLRPVIVAMHVQGLSMKERTGKMSQLYKLITSEPYNRKFSEAGRLTQDLLEVDVHEKKAHDATWKKRGSLAIRLKNVLREIETDVSAVIEGEPGEEGPAAYSVAKVTA